MMTHIGRDLGVFHHRVARKMIGRQTNRVIDVRWVYPLLVDAMEESRLQEVETYVYRRQNKVSKLISTRPIMDLFLAEEMRLG